MKRALLLLFAVITLAITCSKEEVVFHNRTVPREKVPSFGNTVSMSDVMALLGGNVPLSKTDVGDKYDITPYLGENSDTLMFIVNTKNREGWKIYSSDKRTPAVLAEGEHGYFSIEDGSPAVAVWMDCMAKDIARVRRAKDEELTFSAEEIAANKDFWEAPEPLRGHDDTIPLLPPGHWEEIATYSYSEEYDHVDHLTAHWDQDAPYNDCCPFLIYNIGQKAAAGCVALAGAQLLLYLNGKLGVPEYTYGGGSCNSFINNPQWSWWDYSNTVWSTMHTNYISSSPSMLPEAVLIARAGYMLDMNYSEFFNTIFSYAWPPSLKNKLFEPLGISCSSGDYDESIVRSSLLSQMPVIVSASDLLVPANFDIHCFVIDGYRRMRTKYVHYYCYILDDPPTGPPFPAPIEHCTYSYSMPSLTYIKINWGWRSQWQNPPVNDGWYSLTGGWTVINNGTYDYNHNRFMIYGFSASS